MKKVHAMHELLGVKVALYLERNGEIFAYQSHDNFAWDYAAFLAAQILTPEDFTRPAPSIAGQQDTASPTTQNTESATA